jgi:hypothetical protein
MSKIYWTDATGKKWDVKDMSESHINNILNKLSMQDIMSCVAFVQMQQRKQKAKRIEKFRKEFWDNMPEGMQEDYINSVYDECDFYTDYPGHHDTYSERRADETRDAFEEAESEYIRRRMKKGE